MLFRAWFFWRLSALLWFASLESLCHGKSLNIALHAQVAPNANQVVGSVITTDGLKAALSLRDDVGVVRVYYPFHYDGLTETSWDVIIIEGWFPMIHDFLQIVRSIASHPTVLYYCLDPSYPGMNDIMTYDVDGYLTNSLNVKAQLESRFPGRVEHVMLAADPEVMSPNTSIPRTNNALYLGAGGRMLEYKPALLEMVHSAIPFGLTLYGMGWDEMDEATIQAANRGVLPRYEIAQAYSSAVVVLASTIEAQRVEGMINNRIFEAMACGALVLSDHSEALEEISEDTILFYRDGKDVAKWLQWTQDNPEEALKMGERSRQLILSKHSWAHRAVQVMGLVADIESRKTVERRCCDRPNCPTMLWVVADRLKTHIDYSSVIVSHVYAGICRDYNITMFTEDEFVRSLNLSSNLTDPKLLNEFESIILLMSPFDRLDNTVRKYFVQTNFVREAVKVRDRGYGRLQKWSAFYLGTNAGARRSWDNEMYQTVFAEAQAQAKSAGEDILAKDMLAAEVLRFDMYDLLLFRSRAETDDFRRKFHLDNASVASDPCGKDGLRCELLFSTSEVLVHEGSPGFHSPLADTDTNGRGSVDTRSRGDGGAQESPWMKDTDSDNFKSKRALEEEAFERALDENRQARRLEPDPILVVCFWQFSELCARNHRRSMIVNDTIQEDHYRILLLGGSFDDWLSLPDTIDYACLHRVVHIKSGNKGISAMPLFDEVDRVVLMHGDGNHHQQPSCNLREIFSRLASAAVSAGRGGSGEEEVHCSSFDDTTLWPLALAARSGATISTWGASDILLSTAESGLVGRWGGEHLTTMLQRTICKTHSLGSGASRIAISPVGVVQFTVSGQKYLDEFVSHTRGLRITPAHTDLDGNSHPTTDMLLSTLRGGQADDNLFAVGEMSIVFRLHTVNFVPGRDGDICFQILLPHFQRDKSENFTESANSMRYPMETEVDFPRTCLLRLDYPFVLVNVSLLFRPPLGAIRGDYEFSLYQLASTLGDATLEVYARGNMFSDTVDSIQTPLAQFIQVDGNDIVSQDNIDIAEVNVIAVEVLL